MVNTDGETFEVPVITGCSCDETGAGKTGEPVPLSIVQDRNHVIFELTDNSECEEAFAFTRDRFLEELVDSFDSSVSFVTDF